MVETSDTDASGRRAVAHELRVLAHSLVGRHASPRLLDEIAATTSAWNAQLAALPPRRRNVDDYLTDLGGDPAPGDEVRHFDDCPVCGESNPLAVRVPAWRDGDGALAKVRLDCAHQGVPGRSHGGVVAALFDDVMGFVISMRGLTAFQFELSIRYLKPTPIGTELEIRALPVERDGRRFIVDASIVADGVETATARGVHIVVDAQHVSDAAPADLRASDGPATG